MREKREAICARRQRLCAGLLALVSALACGDDSTQGDGPADAGGVCAMGQTETGCMCNEQQPPGVRRCGSDGEWQTCACPPAQPADRCTPGQEIRCFPCPGETERRITTCLQGGTYDCNCTGAPGDEDAGS